MPCDFMSEFQLDYIFIKFANLPQPVMVPWIEVADGKYLPDESTDDEIVVITKKKKTKDAKEGEDDETALQKVCFTKEVLITQLIEPKLRNTVNNGDCDYGPVEDIRIQPAEQDMTKSIYLFLNKYGVQL